MEELLSQDDLVALMRKLCEVHNPFVEWWLLPFPYNDLTTNENGWCQLGGATAARRHSYSVWVHWERRVGNLVPSAVYG